MQNREILKSVGCYLIIKRGGSPKYFFIWCNAKIPDVFVSAWFSVTGFFLVSSNERLSLKSVKVDEAHRKPL